MSENLCKDRVGEGAEPTYVIEIQHIRQTSCMSWVYPDLANHLLGAAKQKSKGLTPTIIFLAR